MTKPSTVIVRLPDDRSYPVLIGRGLDLAAQIGDRRPIVAYDSRLSPPKLRRGAVSIPLPRGEQCKTIGVFSRIIDRLIQLDTGAPLCLVAFGGGAVGDVVGFAAACYRRGIPFLQAPTTLLAMVDASVGGKTAINHSLAKNMIGAFHQPIGVVADLERLRTLPSREFRSGLAEVVKHGIIGDAPLFRMIERDPACFKAWDREGARIAVERSVKLKAAVVRADERETKGVREYLNLGHTLGHAIESVRGYRGILHGEAVAIGMAAAARVSKEITGFDEVDRVEAALRAVGLPVRLKGESIAKMIEATRKDKKRKTGRLRMTLIERIGQVCVVDGIDERLLTKASREIGGTR